ncbi:hypothetical protein C8E95_6822 [Pseudonocardia autotrophica]|uniref:Uncharacterized protein n=2 Tax=Pseudonocardia TaxID=1847 RepID=A0A1Y2MLS0_PSEAH|nr:hypothetical protein BG845_05607 [Pseudonocardia autotrophica]TDN77573.1 hypothetical protein C8E95_6822 [Pseudonocardia autotrophica]BBG01602.1 hypothetical protein Pdca_28110 [Pseudonocardia autotrophica]GEC25347.1 hypothetical protein PSA01_23760 [Pseudonocardia saturnea]
MAACEICWERASRDAHFLGGSVSERYQQRIAEEDQSPTHWPMTLDDLQQQSGDQ